MMILKKKPGAILTTTDSGTITNNLTFFYLFICLSRINYLFYIGIGFFLNIYVVPYLK